MVVTKYKELVSVAIQGPFEEDVQKVSKEIEQGLEAENGEGEAPPPMQKADVRHLRGTTGDGNGRVKCLVEYKF